jgi:glycosyltransferase involved in cell wall biosynthesis
MLGVFLDGTGWSRAACEYAMAMDAAGVDVACRAVRLNDNDEEVDPRVRRLLDKPSGGRDVVIQHLLPSQMEYHGGFSLNAGLFASETSNFRRAGWADRLNMMDEAWVVNEQQVSACVASGVSVPVRVVPHAADLSLYQRSYRPIPELSRLTDAGETLFLWVGEYSRRKNLTAVLRAFHSEFDPSEGARLVIKTSVPGASTKDAEAAVRRACQSARDALKLRGGRFSEEVVITERLPAEDVMRLHASCDCFVTASHGEAWCYPCYDAMAMGKPTIAPAWGGFLSYCTQETSWLVPGRVESCFGATDTLRDIYTADEEWFYPDHASLRRAMRQAFSDPSLRAEKGRAGVVRAYDFSHGEVGLLIKGLLDASLEGRKRV